MMLVAHVTDSHLDGSAEPRDRFLRVAAWLRRLEPSPVAIFLTGDLIQDGATEEYRVVHDALDGIAPLIACPGNSDVRAAFREVFPAPDSRGGEAVNTVLEVDGLTLVALDASVPGDFVGHLDETTIAWLDATLDRIAPETPVLIGVHQPPGTIGHPVVDGFMLDNPEPLAAAIEAHPNVLATLAGHSHSTTVTTFAGKPLIIAPGTSSTMRLSWEATEEHPAMMDADAAPGLGILLIEDDGRLTTHFRAIA